MRPGTILLAFAVVATVQVLVPAGMIAQREATLRYGHPYKFRTAPVDPYDAFRGRYVWLGYEQNHARWNGNAEVTMRSRAYALVQKGPDGFAVIDSVGLEPPKTGDYVKVIQVYRDWQAKSANSVVHFNLPFDRYYMEETAASQAEREYWQQGNRRGQTNHNTYVVVRIRDGDAVLENLFVDGRPISEFVKQSAK